MVSQGSSIECGGESLKVQGRRQWRQRWRGFSASLVDRGEADGARPTREEGDPRSGGFTWAPVIHPILLDIYFWGICTLAWFNGAWIAASST